LEDNEQSIAVQPRVNNDLLRRRQRGTKCKVKFWLTILQEPKRMLVKKLLGCFTNSYHEKNEGTKNGIISRIDE
jgi:hypothetical protein